MACMYVSSCVFLNMCVCKTCSLDTPHHVSRVKESHKGEFDFPIKDWLKVFISSSQYSISSFWETPCIPLGEPNYLNEKQGILLKIANPNHFSNWGSLFLPSNSVLFPYPNTFFFTFFFTNISILFLYKMLNKKYYRNFIISFQLVSFPYM